VILVEGDSHAADAFKCLLQCLHSEVVGVARSAPEALRALADRRVDVALVGTWLPGDDIIALADALDRANVPSLFLGDYGPEEELPPDLQGCPFLRTPAVPESLVSAVSKLLRRSEE
jgi:DNA-binding response OmpR family regulator